MYVKQVLLIGACRHRLAIAWQADVPVRECPDFNSAMQAAVEAAREGDTVLLSPACASFDMFKNYQERGRLFKEIITERLKAKDRSLKTKSHESHAKC